MSGICGWSNNELGLETVEPTLQGMASELLINRRHSVEKVFFEHCALVAVGRPSESGICHRDGVSAAVQGSVRWLGEELTETATNHGLAHAVVDAYLKNGIDCLGKLSGPFALSIIDQRNQKTIIAIDRLGINSLFYTVQKGQLIFSSNARAMACHPDMDNEIDAQAIYDYLYFHMVPSPRCIFKGVEKLLPGQFITFENNTIARDFYWQPRYHESKTYSIDKLKLEFLEILKASVNRTAEEPLTGSFLSGGTDSSTVAGLLRDISGNPVDTYSIGFDAEGFDETKYARLAASHFDTRAHEYYLSPQDVVDAIPIIARAYDEPFGNASAVAAYHCAKLAQADGLNTLLAGDGGDELFGGNERYAKQKVFELYQQIPDVLRHKLIEPAVFNFPLGTKIKPIAKARSYINQSNIPLPDRLETYNFLHRTPLDNIFETDFLAKVRQEEPIELIRETYHRALAETSLNRMLFLDLKFTLADNDLRKVSRMCELAQMEVRYPLLDEELLQFSAELPVSLKVQGFKLRYFFKHALKDFLPQEILNKSKHGFGLPFGIWMNTNSALRELADDTLAGFSRRGIVKPGFITELQRMNREYPAYYGVMIWVLIMLEQWIRTTSDSD